MGIGTLSIIITTYNRPDALALVLEALCAQNAHDFEVVVADDGSDNRTRELIESAHYPIPIKHVWQEDCGFRAAKIRNKAVAQSSGEYLVFMDGDCVPMPGFVSAHRALGETGWLVAGNRVLLSHDFTDKILQEHRPIYLFTTKDFRLAKRKGYINRVAPTLQLPLGPIRKLGADLWRGVKTCNLGVWRRDFVTVNGFDETFEGWGYEDSDLVIRLLRSGVKRKLGRFAVPVLHLWHPESDRSNEQENLAKLAMIENSDHVRSNSGYDQYFLSI